LRCAEAVRDRVHLGNVGLVCHGVLDDDVVLNIETTNLRERTAVGAVIGNELGHDREFLVGIDSHARAEEGLVAHAPRVEVAAILVAVAVVALRTSTASRKRQGPISYA
jgi:hypothetical protein